MATVNSYAQHDSWISSVKSTSNFGTDTDLRIISSGGTQFGCALYRHDIQTDVPGGSSITSATLHIYGGGSVMNAPAIFIYPITDYTWTENGVTWTNKPTHTASIGMLNIFSKSIGTLAQQIYDNGNRWQTLDMTSYVKSQFDAGNKAEFMLYPHSGYTFDTFFRARDGTNPPYITVTY